MDVLLDLNALKMLHTVLENYKFIEHWEMAKVFIILRIWRICQFQFLISCFCFLFLYFSFFRRFYYHNIFFSLIWGVRGLLLFSEHLVLKCQGYTSRTLILNGAYCFLMVIVVMFVSNEICMKKVWGLTKKIAIFRGVSVRLDEYRWFWNCLLCVVWNGYCFSLNAIIIFVLLNNGHCDNVSFSFLRNMDIFTESHWPLLTLLPCCYIMFYV